MFKKCGLVVFFLVAACAGPALGFDLGGVEIHGFASTGYMASTDNNFLLDSDEGSFQFNEAGVNFGASMTDNIRIGLQFYSFDLGDIGNNDVNLDWAFLDYKWKNEFGLRLGKIKTPLGLYNEVRDYDMLRTSILLPQGMYYRYLRETSIGYTGGGAYGNISMGKAGTLGYDLIGGTMEIEDDGGMAKYLTTSDRIFDSGEIDHVFGGRLGYRTPLTGLRFAATFFQVDVAYDVHQNVDTGTPIEIPVDIDIEIPELQAIYLSAEYSVGNLTVAAEYGTWQGDITTTQDLSPLGLPSPAPSTDDWSDESYYILASYRLTDWFEAGAYYSMYYSDADDRDGDRFAELGEPDYLAWQEDIAVSARFDITDFWLVKLEVHFMDGAARCSPADNPEGFEEDWMLYAVKTTFNF